MCECEKAEAKASAGAPEHEIEITPEMVRRGGAALWEKLCHDPLMSFGISEDLAEVVLRVALVPKSL